ncbi:hypothetical protein DPMN_140016 [Dreissena polymorpha]|uniref:Uncharacterized protein n=1 Tax=Dreissena polymorpha TaxID=45954 RepID=A0A9D4GAQ1_DREPO|nr:hypothetical protein DPMN_140016 [Dreissena polymorpha]
MCYLPKGGDEVRIPPSVPHITNEQDTQRDPHPNPTRYVGSGTHTRIALTPPLIKVARMRAPRPCVPGSLVVICVWLCIVCGMCLLCICLERKRRCLSVIYGRRSVVKGCILLQFPDRRTRRPRTSAPTPSEPEPPPPRPHTAPARAPNRDPRDKHPHPPTRCARQQICQEPTMEPSYPKSPSFFPTRLPNIQIMYQAGMY